MSYQPYNQPAQGRAPKNNPLMGVFGGTPMPATSMPTIPYPGQYTSQQQYPQQPTFQQGYSSPASFNYAPQQNGNTIYQTSVDNYGGTAALGTSAIRSGNPLMTANPLFPKPTPISTTSQFVNQNPSNLQTSNPTYRPAVPTQNGYNYSPQNPSQLQHTVQPQQFSLSQSPQHYPPQQPMYPQANYQATAANGQNLNDSAARGYDRFKANPNLVDLEHERRGKVGYSPKPRREETMKRRPEGSHQGENLISSQLTFTNDPTQRRAPPRPILKRANAPKKGRSATFDQNVLVHEVESWKLYNVDMGKEAKRNFRRESQQECTLI
jgi:hypothetical protein